MSSTKSAMSVAVMLISAALFITCCQCQGDETGEGDPMCPHGHGCSRPTPPMHKYDDYDDHDEDDDVPIWPIVVGVVVGVVIIIIIIVVIVVVCKRKRVRTAVNHAVDKYGVAVMQGHQNEVGLQSSEEKKEPPPAYTGPASTPKIDSDVGVQPPPYTIQLPPYIQAENLYIGAAAAGKMTPVELV